MPKLKNYSVEEVFQETVVEPYKKSNKKTSRIYIGGANAEGERLQKTDESYERYGTLEKSLLKVLDGTGDEPTVERLAFERDPTTNNYSAIYVPKERLVPDWLCKRIAVQCDIFAACIQMRSNHVSAFARPRPSRASTGFVIQLNQETVERIENESATDEEKKQAKTSWQKRIAKASKLLMTCGNSGKFKMLAPEGSGYVQSYQQKMSFPQFMSQITRSALVVGRIAVEILYRADKGERKFFCFRPIDAGTIYQARPEIYTEGEDVKKRIKKILSGLRSQVIKGQSERLLNGEFAWIQVVEGVPQEAFTAEECRVHNFYSVPDIELNGYPLTPIDTALTAIITHINVTTYTKLYFESGKGCRGFLVIKSEEVDEKYVDKVRQVFNAQVNSVSNCLAGNSRIMTEDGPVTLEGFLDGRETRMTRLWTGTSWEEAMVYKAPEKKALTGFELLNGEEIECSPDHRFWVIGPDGDPVWKKQSEMAVGDFVAVNKKSSSLEGRVPTVNGRPIGEDLMEVLGWAVGDGTLSDSSGKLYYHHLKERDIWVRHADILAKYDLPARAEEHFLTDEEKEYAKEKYGFKTIADSRIGTWLHADTVKAFKALGLTESKRGVDSDAKTIPAWIYVSPEKLKGAFLKGLFSADGTCTAGRSPRITVCNHALRRQVRELLSSIGIRCTASEGKIKLLFDGKKRTRVQSKSFLMVKDRPIFFDKVGFIQEHKQEKQAALNRGWGMSQGAPFQTMVKYIKTIKEKLGYKGSGYKCEDKTFTKREQSDLGMLLRGGDKGSLPRLMNYMSRAGVEIPSWMTDYHWEQVGTIKPVGEKVDMFDVSVYEKTHTCLGLECKDQSHSFTCGWMYTKNSHRLPVFGITTTEEIAWQPLEGGASKDMEFQYLNDMTARVILSALSMDPEEVSGWRYLSRGTSSQALSEGNKEYQLTAARDVGIRPLLAQMEDFVNSELLPLIDEDLALNASLKFVGLDAETPEKEAQRLITDSALHMTMDEVLDKVEKRPIGKEWGGEFPLNQTFQQTVLFKFFTIGQMLEKFMGIEGASSKPEYAYIPDSMWFTNQQLIQAAQQAQAQAQQQQAQGAPGGQPAPGGGGGGAPPEGSPEQSGGPGGAIGDGAETENQKSADVESASASGGGDDLQRSISMALEVLGKSDPVKREKLLKQQRQALQNALGGMQEDLQASLKDIVSSVKALP